MELDRFKAAWQQQPLEGAATRGVEDIMRDVRERAATFNRQIRWRDGVETVAGLIGSALFGYYLWVVPQPVAKIGAAVVIAGCASVMIRLHLTRTRHRPRADSTAREFCANELRRIDGQIRLLSTVGWWYLAPLLGGVALFIWGSGGPAVYRGLMVALIAVLGLIVYTLNRRAAARHLQPMRDDLARILRDMTATQR